MKNKKIYIWLISVISLSIASFIISYFVGKSIDYQSILESKGSLAGVPASNFSDNINSSLDLAFFLFGFGGIKELIGIDGSFQMIVFSIFSLVLFPIFIIALFILVSITVVIIILDFLKRDADVTTVKMIGKYGLYVTFVTSLSFIFIGIIILCSIKNPLTKDLNLVLVEGHKYDTFALITFLIFLSDGSIFGFAKDSIISSSAIEIWLIIGLVFLIILLPISEICFIVFASMYIGVFIARRENRNSRFLNWLKNIRIDSVREYRELIYKNTWFWILSACYLISVLIPGLVHSYDNLIQISISIFVILTMLFAYIPILIGYIKAKRIKRFNYNRLMFIQIIVLLALTWTLQLVIWIIFKDYVLQESWLNAFTPFVLCTVSLFSAFGFVKFSNK